MYGNRTRVTSLRGSRPRPLDEHDRQKRGRVALRACVDGGAHRTLVHVAGIAPAASVASGQRSASELHVHFERVMGNDPISVSLEGCCITSIASPAFSSEGRDRTCDILVNSQALLPLNYLGMIVEPAAGIAPATPSLQVMCSSN